MLGVVSCWQVQPRRIPSLYLLSRGYVWCKHWIDVTFLFRCMQCTTGILLSTRRNIDNSHQLHSRTIFEHKRSGLMLDMSAWLHQHFISVDTVHCLSRRPVQRRVDEYQRYAVLPLSSRIFRRDNRFVDSSLLWFVSCWSLRLTHRNDDIKL